MNRRHQEYARDWRGENHTRPWPKQAGAARSEWLARIAFGLVGGAALAGYLILIFN